MAFNSALVICPAASAAFNGTYRKAKSIPAAFIAAYSPPDSGLFISNPCAPANEVLTTILFQFTINNCQRDDTHYNKKQPPSGNQYLIFRCSFHLDRYFSAALVPDCSSIAILAGF